jgi:hypothetical protein
MGAGDVMSMRFSADARVDAKVRAFVVASKDLVGVAAQAELEAATACRRMGHDLGMSDAEMARRSGEGGDAAGACEPLAARIQAILRSGVRIQVSAVPPQCQASAQAEAACSGSCSAQVSPGEIVARCEPGRLSGTCQGRCVGHCDGQCQGDCAGQCSARDASGRCAGACSGDCSGSCGGTCHARCEGSWQAPRCEGSVQGPSADAECNASCHAHASFTASCTPARVDVQTQGVDIAQRLAATLRANLPQLLHAEIALGKRVMGDARVLGQVGAQLPRVVGQAGAQALACIGAAADASVRASARIDVSVRASASVSGSVGAGG